jgi:small subunit ribosomal protein S7
MSRKKRDYKREVLPDPKFGSVLVSKTINALTLDGKKCASEKAFYRSLDIIGQKTNTEVPLEVFIAAIANVKPIIEVRSRRVGGANYQVPTEVRPERAQSLAIRWLVNSANSRSERRIEERLANEIIDAKNNRGVAIKKKEDTHKMAEANKAFAHFKW